MPEDAAWTDKVVSPEEVLERIRPGMSIFLSTGAAEPRTLVRSLIKSGAGNLQDLELVQLVSLGDLISDSNKRKFRLKTFFSGWVASEAITQGRVDLIPSNFHRVARHMREGRIRIDVAFVQITPSDEAGFASMGVSVDVARQAMESASLVVGEIQKDMPRTMGDTFVHVNDFDFLVESAEPMILIPRPPAQEAYDLVAAQVASVIEDGACLAFSMEPLFEALAPHLSRKKDLGIHSPFFTDPLMDLVKSGAVTNRKKKVFKGKCLASYALGSQELMHWLQDNPLVEFQGLDVLGDPDRASRNPRFTAILPARKVDLTGQLAFHSGRGNLGTGPGVAADYIQGVAMSEGGRVIVALPSQNRKGEPNILDSIGDYDNQYTNREGIDLVVTEFGVANMMGRTIRERAQALIDIAHPADRAELVGLAKEKNILYPDQIYLAESGDMYPHGMSETRTLKDDLELRFRAIRPSDEEDMRRLFYRFSSEAVYYRYFSPIKAMPHAKMQQYVNVDYTKTMSIVGIVGDPGEERIIAEARYVRLPDRPWADIAFVVDEGFQGKGVATYLFSFLTRIARDRGVEGFTSDVLATNKSMIKVFERSNFPVKASLEAGVYHLEISFCRIEPDRPDRICFRQGKAQ